MPNHALSQRSAWADRWSQPSLDALVGPLKAQHRRLFENLMEYLGSLPGVERSILWYGPAWKWTIHFSLPPEPGAGRGAPRPTLCYLVPRVEAPAICIPLGEAMIEELPLTRLSKFVRDGIKMAKCAVAIHWATWTPNTLHEVTQLLDLLKRRHKFAMAGQPASQKSEKPEKTEKKVSA